MKRRVLLVEDDALLARPLTRLLGRHGFDVTHVRTCAEAIAAPPGFELAVLDMELPDGIGLELYEDLKRLNIVPVGVFYTAAPAQLVREARRVARCVEKSEGIELLIHAMDAALAEVALPVAAGCSEMAPAPSSNEPPESGRKRR